MTWHVVKFLTENSVEAVPKSWYIERSSECFWPPPSCKREKIFKYIELEADPQSDWNVYGVKRLGTYDDFNVAQRKAKKAITTSDISSCNDLETKTKRTRKKNPKFQSYSDESSASADISSDDNQYPPLKSTVFQATCSNKMSPRKKTLVRVRSRSYSPDKSKTINSDRLSTVEERSDTLFGKRSLLGLSSQQSSDYPRKVGTQNVSMVLGENRNGDYVVPNNDDFKKVVIAELSSLHLKINSLTDNLLIVMNVLRKGTEINCSSDELLDQVRDLNQRIPVQTKDQLIELEKWLEEYKHFKLMVSEFRRIGGQSMPQATRKILYRTLSNEVASCYSWDGMKQKDAFKQLALAKGILESIKMLFPQALECDVISVIKIWLVKAKERLKNQRIQD